MHQKIYNIKWHSYGFIYLFIFLIVIGFSTYDILTTLNSPSIQDVFEYVLRKSGIYFILVPLIQIYTYYVSKIELGDDYIKGPNILCIPTKLNLSEIIELSDFKLIFYDYLAVKTKNKKIYILKGMDDFSEIQDKLSSKELNG